LSFPRFGVQTALGDELFVIAGFDNLTIAHDVDDICPHGKGETVGDDDCRPTIRQSPEAF
jgi:hypothetical protein